MASVIQYESVRFRYEDGETEILRDLSLEIEPGQFTVIAGPSGEGKSTFCRTLNNIIPLFFKGEFSGKRWVAGEWLEKQSTSSMARKVGMVFQDFEQQLFSTNALLELSFGLENFGVSRAEMDQRMEELLQRFHLRHLSRREPFSMSGGEKQKLAIASVLAYKPQILVLDEPTTDLDPESKHFVMQTLPELKDWVETVLIVDHETDRFQDADRVFLFRDGAIQSSGKPVEILTNSTLLEANSLAPLDLAVLQARLNEKPGLATPMELASSWSDSQLQPFDWPSRTAAPAVIDVINLSYRYENRDVEALQDVSFEIRKGEFLGIIGQNGSGKSTLLRHLNGLQYPQKGSIRILGKEIRDWNRKDLSKTTALVFQNPDHQIFNTTVREEVEFGPQQLGFSEEQRKKNVKRALQTMDLEAQQQRDPFQLSKGERQRVAVACMLSVSPEILMLDEPTTGLDYRQQTYLMQLLRELNKEGATIIIVTHSLKLVGDYCNYAILMEKGQKKAEGHPRDLFFRNHLFSKLPPLWELSRIMKGNALTVDEFASALKKRQ
jgi:energy-coupling factor transporter ATP-binding protein EcfA2